MCYMILCFQQRPDLCVEPLISTSAKKQHKRRVNGFTGCKCDPEDHKYNSTASFIGHPHSCSENHSESTAHLSFSVPHLQLQDVHTSEAFPHQTKHSPLKHRDLLFALSHKHAALLQAGFTLHVQAPRVEGGWGNLKVHLTVKFHTWTSLFHRFFISQDKRDTVILYKVIPPGSDAARVSKRGRTPH